VKGPPLCGLFAFMGFAFGNKKAQAIGAALGKVINNEF